MAQKYLLAVDNSDTADRIAEFLRKIINKNDKVTLYSVLPNPFVIYNLSDPAGLPIYTENKEIFTMFEENRKEELNKMLENVKKTLAKSGYDKKDVKFKFDNQNGTVAHQIAEFAEKGKYDSIIMGKHNSSILTEVILGSVTHKVIHLSKKIPVVVV